MPDLPVRCQFCRKRLFVSVSLLWLGPLRALRLPKALVRAEVGGGGGEARPAEGGVRAVPPVDQS